MVVEVVRLPPPALMLEGGRGGVDMRAAPRAEDWGAPAAVHPRCTGAEAQLYSDAVIERAPPPDELPAMLPLRRLYAPVLPPPELMVKAPLPPLLLTLWLPPLLLQCSLAVVDVWPELSRRSRLLRCERVRVDEVMRSRSLWLSTARRWGESEQG
jgi:hypothetical protein